MATIARKNLEVDLGNFQSIKPRWGLALAAGMSLILLGMLAVARPFVSSLAVELFLGWLLLVGGVVQIFHAIKERKQRGFGLALFTAIVTSIAGFVLLAYPLSGVLTLTLILSCFFFVEGVCNLSWAFKVRPKTGWGWLLFSGVLEVVFAAMIWMQWPSSAIWLIGFLVGFDLIMAGWSLLTLSLGSRSLMKN